MIPDAMTPMTTVRSRALVAGLALSAAALAGGCASGGPPRIVDRPITFSGERIEMTKDYIREHYGIEDPGISITPRILVLHWTAVPTMEGSWAAFQRETLGGRPDISSAGQVNVSVQFLVDRDGTIHRLMPEIWMGRHVIGLNYEAIGVENVGGADGTDDLTEAQLEANVALVRYLAEKHPTIEYLIGHHEYLLFEGHPLWRELDPEYRTEKSDPGERFMSAVREEVADLGLKGPEEIRREKEDAGTEGGAGASRGGGAPGEAPARTASPGAEGGERVLSGDTGSGRPQGVMPDVVPHEAWEESPPTGHPAEAVRRNLPPGGALDFRGLSVTVREIVAADRPPGGGEDGDDEGEGEAAAAAGSGGGPAAAPDTAVLGLAVGGGEERLRVAEGAAFDRGGFHIAVLAVNAAPGELGGGLVELEAATLASLPEEVAASARAGGAEMRLRVPHEIERITLHHSGSAEPLRPDDDPVEKLRGLQEWGARERNWWDVPYHFLLDLDGTVYEGRDYRWAGETNTAYDPRGHLLISVIGNYDEQEPTAAQVEAIRELIAWAAAEFDVPPRRVGGHGDYADTSCPGKHLRRHLDDGTFREAARSR